MDSRNLPGHEIARLTPVSRRIIILVYYLIGLLQTIFAFVIFNRPVDHYYFLEIANRGVIFSNPSTIPLFEVKSQVAGLVFYWICTPSRLLGGYELGHILWLRFLALWGFLLAYKWISRVAGIDKFHKNSNQPLIYFVILILIYPGQLAWTASLLRDGISCTALFAAFLSFFHRRWVVGFIAVFVCLALRPEFVLLIALMMIPTSFWRFLTSPRFRIITLGILCVVFSLATFLPRSIQSNFADTAFGADGLAYPTIQGFFDYKGYLLVAAQAVMDPLPLQALNSGGLFHVIEVLFFCVVIVEGLRLLRRANLATTKLLVANFVVMWAFAYFEIFVSGFSRHRLALMVALIAVISAEHGIMARRYDCLDPDSHEDKAG